MHADHGNPEEISEALRIYNSHLSRLEVLTYDDLIHGAERALEIAAHVPDLEDGDSDGW